MKQEWWKLGVVALVAVLLAGAGSVIASNIAPSPPPAAGVDSDTPTTVSRLPTTTRRPVVTTVTPAPTTTVPTAGSLEPSSGVIDFGDGGDTGGFDLVNSGDVTVSWSIQSSDPSVTASPAEGQIEPGDVLSISVTLDRASVAEGELESNLTIAWNGGEAQIAIAGVQSDLPIIHAPKASPSTVKANTALGCSPTLTTVSAKVTDSSDLAEVYVRWDKGTGLVETSMALVAEDIYEANIGPFSAAGSPAVKVIAKDIHDNAGGAVVSLTVAPCP